MRVVVVGAGIGGLAAAVALRKVGVEALVLEGAASVREVGAGTFNLVKRNECPPRTWAGRQGHGVGVGD
jgi:2-polyprenyl-6-methoxyphenol hydroxylase-like FAD-dependent oxidoreductase